MIVDIDTTSTKFNLDNIINYRDNPDSPQFLSATHMLNIEFTPSTNKSCMRAIYEIYR